MKIPLVTLLGVGLVALAPLALSEFSVTMLNYIGLAALATLGLVLLTGVAGITSFGQAAFVGLGAYTTAWLTTTYGVSPWVTLLIGWAFTACTAWAIGWMTLRLSGHYLSLSTMAWGLSLYFVFGNLDSLGGHTGIDKVPALSVGPIVLDSQRSFYYLVWSCLLGAMLLVRNLLDSRQGRSIRALRRGSMMVQAFGVNVASVKTIVFVYAAMLAALSGWLYAHLLRFVSPTPFGLNVGIEYLFMAVIGGASHVVGAVVGAATLILLKQGLQDWLPSLVGQTANYEMVVFGVLMILLLQHARTGVLPLLTRRFIPLRNAPAAQIPSGTPLPRRTQPVAGELVLEVTHATKTFGGLVAVDDVTFELRSSEILGLIGPNGAGKTTTFNLVTGVLALSRGEVRFCGRVVSGMPLREIVALGMARTFQHVQLIPAMSVLDNVALGAYLRGRAGVIAGSLRLDRREESNLRCEAARQLERVGLGARMHEPAGDLPLGQQRILEIARALTADPILLLLDEPAAGLRHREKQELSELLRKLRSEGMTILIVEHDMDMVMKLVDRLVVMDSGRKLADDTPRSIQQNRLVKEAYLGIA
jgi:ABC-type branched-subunit amino acid transport system ATPase component/ABC-type branched-subunit amino acid transport system permease subunit